MDNEDKRASTDRRTDPPAVAGAEAALKKVVEEHVGKTRKVNIGLIFTIIGQTASILTLITLLWQFYNDRGANTYLNCLNLAALQVSEPSCEPYRAWIEMFTNVIPPPPEVNTPEAIQQKR